MTNTRITDPEILERRCVYTSISYVESVLMGIVTLSLYDHIPLSLSCLDVIIAQFYCNKYSVTVLLSFHLVTLGFTLSLFVSPCHLVTAVSYCHYHVAVFVPMITSTLHRHLTPCHVCKYVRCHSCHFFLFFLFTVIMFLKDKAPPDTLSTLSLCQHIQCHPCHYVNRHPVN